MRSPSPPYFLANLLRWLLPNHLQISETDHRGLVHHAVSILETQIAEHLGYAQNLFCPSNYQFSIVMKHLSHAHTMHPQLQQCVAFHSVLHSVLLVP